MTIKYFTIKINREKFKELRVSPVFKSLPFLFFFYQVQSTKEGVLWKKMRFGLVRSPLLSLGKFMNKNKLNEKFSIFITEHRAKNTHFTFSTIDCISKAHTHQHNILPQPLHTYSCQCFTKMLGGLKPSCDLRTRKTGRSASLSFQYLLHWSCSSDKKDPKGS